MAHDAPTCPLDRAATIDRYFLEHRAKLLDIAAFLDRVDRARPTGEGTDYRVAALLEALKLLGDGRPERTKRALEVFSDHTTEPIASAAGLKGAFGAWNDAAGGSS